ncbi:MAG: hypothetical protein ABIK65_04195 [Candidatus Eisenbacteria bacterium]
MHGKNAVGISIVALLLSLDVTAARADRVSIAIQAGMGLARTLSAISSIDADRIHTKFLPVFSGGATVDWAIPGQEALSLESGILFRMKGGHVDIDD